VTARRLRAALVTVLAAVGLLVVAGGFGALGSLELAVWSALTTVAVVAVDRVARADGGRP
jgi:hypothetical protein